MSELDQTSDDYRTYLRRRRIRRTLTVLILFVCVAACTFAAYAYRTRSVLLLGNRSRVGASAEGIGDIRFRPTTYGMRSELRPGEYPLEGETEGLRSAIEIPAFPPWPGFVVAPVVANQCIVVADPIGLYEAPGSWETVPPEQSFFIEEITATAREVLISPLASEVVMHPCRLPLQIDLFEDHLRVVLSVACDERPRDAVEASRLLARVLNECP